MTAGYIGNTPLSVSQSPGVQFAPQGRLTLVTGVPVMTTDQSAKSTVYWTPYIGQQIPIYNGNFVANLAFGQVSLVLNSTDNTNGNIYDIFGYATAGVFTGIGTGPAWTTATVGSGARGTGAGTTELVSYQGIYTNANAITLRSNGSSLGSIAVNQATYLGTVYCTANGQTAFIMRPAGASGGGSPTLGLWNCYNRVSVPCLSLDTGVGYTYTTGTVRQARASTGNQINFIHGLAEDGTVASVKNCINTVASNGAQGYCGIGLDSTSAYAITGLCFRVYNNSTTQGTVLNATIGATIYAGLGLHYLSSLEQGDGGNANTFTADNSSSITATIRA